MHPLVIDFPFGLSVDFSFWLQVLSWPSDELIRAIIVFGGWAIIALVLFFMGSVLWSDYREGKYTANWKWILLALDIPEELVQSPKAVEQIYAHLSGATSNIRIAEKYWDGRKQRWFSLEIVSIEGYIQFLIRAELEHRDLVEAAIYAQYPGAEITEVEDYADALAEKYPNEKYDIYGLEFGLAQEDAYPIRTYEEFEHGISKDVVFNDPMAALLENFSRIGSGENLWMQIIIKPTDNSWKEKGIELAKRLIEQKSTKKTNPVMDFLGSIPMKIGQEAINVWDWNWPESEDSSSKEERPKGMSDMTPGMRGTVEAIEEKISRIGFKSKMRILYSARKEVFNASKSVHGLIGAINQFFNSNRNGLVPKIETKTNKEKGLFVKGYKKRKLTAGKSPFILNIEELATIWHFPLAFVKTPLVQKTASRRAEPPIDLPMDLPPGLFVKEEDEVGQATQDIKKASDLIDDAHRPLSSSDVDSGRQERTVAKPKPDDNKSDFSADLPYG
ncbi:MAG: hypothetical protein ABIH87_00385 [bacterium]